MTLQETINEVFAKHDAECLLLTEQRDKARQEICHTKKRRLITHLDYARKRGWNCFWVDYSKQGEKTP